MASKLEEPLTGTTNIVGAEDVADWMPFRFVPRDGQIFIEWIEMDGRGFPEPFFNQTIARRYLETNERIRVTKVETLLERAATSQSLPLAAFIYHTSRSGSTLLSNAMKTIPGAVVLSEPYPLSQLVEYPHRRNPAAPWADWFRALMICLTEARRDIDQFAVIKFSSHAALEIDLISALFPAVPNIVLYRDPLTIMASVLREPTYWMELHEKVEKAARLFGVRPEEIADLPREDYCGFALGRICESLLAHAPMSAWFLNYSDLSPNTVWALADKLGLASQEGSFSELESVFKLDAKSSTGEEFAPKLEKEDKAATTAMRASCRRYLAQTLARLDNRCLESPSISVIGR